MHADTTIETLPVSTPEEVGVLPFGPVAAHVARQGDPGGVRAGDPTCPGHGSRSATVLEAYVSEEAASAPKSVSLEAGSAGAFYRDLLAALEANALRGGTAIGAAAVAKRVALDYGVEGAEWRPLPRLTRWEEERLAGPRARGSASRKRQ